MTNSYLSNGLFSSKNVVITGAGRGIGAAVAAAFAADGANVLAHLGREESREHWVFPAANQQGRVTTFSANMERVEGVEQLVAELTAAVDHIDVLIHNAGTCLLYTSPSPRDATLSRMPSSA